MPCCARSSSATCARRGPLRATNTRLYLSRAKSFASSCPIPVEAPVMRAVWLLVAITMRHLKRLLPHKKGVPIAGTPCKIQKAENLRSDQCRLAAIKRVPRGRGLQLVVHVLDVLHAFTLEPLPESGSALLRVHRDAFLPSCPPAEHAVELHARLAR